MLGFIRPPKANTLINARMVLADYMVDHLVFSPGDTILSDRYFVQESLVFCKYFSSCLFVQLVKIRSSFNCFYCHTQTFKALTIFVIIINLNYMNKFNNSDHTNNSSFENYGPYKQIVNEADDRKFRQESRSANRSALRLSRISIGIAIVSLIVALISMFLCSC